MLERCPQCNYGPLKETARHCIRCGKVFPDRVAKAKAEAAMPVVKAKAGPSEFVDIQCTACKRPYRVKPDQFAARVARGQTACQACGGALEIPAEIRELVDRIADEGKVLPARVECPCCDRPVANNPAGGAALVICAFCNARFPVIQKAGDAPFLGPLEPGERAGVDAVRAETALIPAQGLGPVLREVLVGKAQRGELLRGEAAQLVDVLMRASAWPATSGFKLPLTPGEAHDLIPRAFFRTERFFIEEHDRSSDIVITLDETQRESMHYEQQLTVGNVLLSAITDGAIGLGRQPEVVVENRQKRLRIGVTQTQGGIDISLRVQFNQQRSMTLVRDREDQASVWLASKKSALVGYSMMLMVMGPLARGAPLFLAQPAGIAKRIRLLAPTLAAHADDAARALCLHHLKLDAFPL